MSNQIKSRYVGFQICVLHLLSSVPWYKNATNLNISCSAFYRCEFKEFIS